MKKSPFRYALVALMFAGLCTAPFVAAQRSDPAAALLQSAIHKQIVDGDLKEAIKMYNEILSKYASNKAVAAEALLHMGDAHQKLGSPEAKRTYERIVSDYAGEGTIVREAQARLAAMGVTAASPATALGGLAAKRVFSGDGGGGIPTPDEKWLVRLDFPGIAVHDLISKATRVLVRTPEGSASYASGPLVISADGRYVAYTWEELPGKLQPEYEVQIRIVPIDGTVAPRIVHRGREYLSLRGWTPDGSKLLVTRGADDGTLQIAMLSVRDGAIQQLRSLGWEGIGNVRMSPDGRYIAYDQRAGDATARDIFILATDGSQETPVVQHPANDYGAVWSPDGARILFLSDRTATPSIWSVPIENGKPAGPVELAKADIGESNLLTITHTGTLYYRTAEESRNVLRASLGSDGKASGFPEVITKDYGNSNWGASLSADSKRLAYYSRREGNTVLVVRDLTSGGERSYPLNLAGGRTIMYNGPGWLADGHSLLVHGEERGQRTLYRLDLDSGHAEPESRTGQAFKLSADGRFAFHQGNPLKRVDLATGQVTALGESSNPEVGPLVSPAISADGKRLAYAQFSFSGQAVDIVVMDAQGGEPRPIFRYPTPPNSSNPYNTLAWTSDHRRVLFTTPGGTIWRIPADGGPAEQIGVTMNAMIKGIQMHPDGRSLFFTAVATSDEIWAIENILPAPKTQ